ncbi:hypothetical protein A2567_00040 [Candidatus Azambacteria bacterium RIFOXYD1_FULL_42_11]|uniref:Uncharacterized protein n=4 Tax=Candidatus Azamiibacteriota TaxID=1752741 RepID=A0A0G0ZAH6_9BACT|nr:MAG: hypothetical protein UV07_C0019G0004 [Candidatus Azambacteria bacterium GW2011_GWB1_42_17]KKS45695.1 MAG: hypothetical protein UV10_C0016G0009 [Candidatus Azambacteria bacterium GW2011_GWA1_42_19]KKS74954.1 MAG: hypothetical protein UV48_C0023G0007 [Candidatus Azambacteria bacterium GW2011_GWA2_42_9]KKS87999.1 MAG: hypothetical protein UV62_C0018G0004 [Parcubacteria group bacterium GW2011_GWC1_43_11]OGD41956.1 MAG: hypothetical protein A2567_00040 [Candidatus Azambacteria bacterium RIFO
MAEKCLINNELIIHLTPRTGEPYKTELDKFEAIFSACRHQVFEGWGCRGPMCINLPLGQKDIEEKVVNDHQSELRCPNCGWADVYNFYTLDYHPEMVEPTMI